jgi:hypothetical protein
MIIFRVIKKELLGVIFLTKLYFYQLGKIYKETLEVALKLFIRQYNLSYRVYAIFNMNKFQNVLPSLYES